MMKAMNKYTVRNTCRACGNGNLKEYLDLTDQPLANSYHKDGEVLDKYPLRAMVCSQCFHSQLSVVVDPEEMYKHYLYVSGVSKTWVEYCEFFAEWTRDVFMSVHDRYPNNVLDIASNDGTLLDSYKALNIKTYGVDPAENLNPVARKKGHDIVDGFWSSKMRDILFIEFFDVHSSNPITVPPFDIITAQNVFAHVDDVDDFLDACKLAMHDGSLLFIQTSQADMLQGNQFDTIYHEHLSFFNTRSMRALAIRKGMKLEAVHKMNIHGVSYVFILSKNGVELDSNTVFRELKEEQDAGIYSMTTYTQFAKNAKRCVTNLKKAVAKQKKAGKTVVGYGAAAKGMTVLNFGKIDLDYIVDDTPIKQGLFTPGMNIPIVTQEYLKSDPTEKVFVILAWNFTDEIATKLNTITGTTNTYIKYFPTLQEVTL